jgi:hypothetical protein
VTIRGSEVTVAQPVSEIAAIARAASRGIQHLALHVIGVLHGFEAFDEATRALARTPEREQEQDKREGNGAIAQRSPCR